MRFIFRGSAIPYFFIGFILWMSMNDPSTAADDSRVLITIAVLGVALAWLHLSFERPSPVAEAGKTADAAAAEAGTPAGATGPGPGAPSAAPGTAGADEGRTIRVTRGDLIRSWMLWTFFSQANYNYERLQGTGFAHAMTPIIRRLYQTPEEIRAALQRHLVFFNTEPNFGNVVHGAVIAMEEQRANGAPIDDDAINSVKSGLMGPMAGIGDSISQGTVTPILLALGIGLAGGTANISIGSGSAGIPTLTNTATGNPIGAIVYAILISAAVITIGYVAWTQGYVRGRAVVTDLLRSGAINRVLIGAGVLGNLVLGALAARFVVAYLAPTVTIAGASLNLQAGLLDPIFAGLLPLTIVLATWWLIKRVSPLWLVLAYLVISIVAAYPFFGPGQTTNPSPAAQYQACTSSLLHPYYPCGAPPAPAAAPTAAPSATAAP